MSPYVSPEQDAERAAEDPDQQTEQASARRSLGSVRADAVLDREGAAVTAHDHCGRVDTHTALRVEFLQRGQCAYALLSASKDTEMTLYALTAAPLL